MNDLLKARQHAEMLRDTPLWEDTLQALRDAGKSPCPKCQHEQETLVDDKTLEIAVYCENCRVKEIEGKDRLAQEHAKKSIEMNIEKILSMRGVPKRFLIARIEDFPKKFLSLVNKDRGYYLHGSSGVGKTHLAVAIMRHEILNLEPEQNYHKWHVPLEKMPLFVPVIELLLDIRNTYNNSEISEKTIIDKYTRVNLLVLDDLGAEKTTEWVLQALYIIIDRRSREEMHTIITSNLNLSELKNKLDNRIASRIAGLCDVQEVEGKDRRLMR